MGGEGQEVDCWVQPLTIQSLEERMQHKDGSLTQRRFNDVQQPIPSVPPAYAHKKNPLRSIPFGTNPPSSPLCEEMVGLPSVCVQASTSPGRCTNVFQMEKALQSFPIGRFLGGMKSGMSLLAASFS